VQKETRRSERSEREKSDTEASNSRLPVLVNSRCNRPSAPIQYSDGRKCHVTLLYRVCIYKSGCASYCLHKGGALDFDEPNV